jgi:NAD+ kinase
VTARRIGFVLRHDKPDAQILASELAAWLTGLGHQVYALDSAVAGAKVVPEATLAQHIDLLIVLGGDGTLLQGGALVAEAGVPVLGINLGRLGFLAPFEPGRAREVIAQALAGELAIEERMRLRVTLHAGDKLVAERFALNDTVIAQASMARLVELRITLDGTAVTSLRADGLIICTPTGSTAYNLAAGGPILHPALAAMVLTPICPHMLSNRPLVIAEESVVEVRLRGAREGEVHITFDGQRGFPLERTDVVTVTRSPRTLRLVKAPERDYYEVLRSKLKWGESSTRRS